VALFYAERESPDGTVLENPYLRLTAPFGYAQNANAVLEYYVNMRNDEYDQDTDFLYDPYHRHTIWNSTDKGTEKGLPPECK
tara:strand:- start:189 stop:434 length:246 start_codon:yes stop_codon:yes gene_type:complete